MNKDQREIQRKLRILRHADEAGHIAKTCRYFGIGRTSFYRWRNEAGIAHCFLEWLSAGNTETTFTAPL